VSQGIKIDEVFEDIASSINFEKRKEFFNLVELIIDGQVESDSLFFNETLFQTAYKKSDRGS
jgi:putative resolvase